MKKQLKLLALVLALMLCFTCVLTACGEKDPCEHNFVEGECTKCGEEDPNYTPPTPGPGEDPTPGPGDDPTPPVDNGEYSYRTKL